MRPVAVLRNGISKRKTRKGGSYVQGSGILDVLLLEQEQTCKERQGGYLQCHVDDGILWFLNLTALHLLFEAWGWDMLTGWFSSLTDKVEWSRFNPVAYLFAAAMLAPFIWIARKLYYRPAKLKAMQAKYETMGEYRKLLGQCLFWLYITGSFASFFIIAEQKNHSKEQPLIERLQEIRDGKYPVEKTHSPTGKTYSPTGE